MKHIDIEINLKDIILRIQTHTYYTGKARKESGTALRIATGMQLSDCENTQLYDHLDIACHELSNIISRYLGTCNIKGNGNTDSDGNRIIVYSLKIPGNYPAEIMEQTRQSIINYAVMRTIELWFMQCKPDETPLIANEVHKSAIHLYELLAMRKRPQKETDRNRKHLDI